MEKNILVVAASSELAKRTIEELKHKGGYKIYATNRGVDLIDDKIISFKLDVTKEEEFYLLKDKINKIDFDTIINFSGIAFCSPVEEINEIDLKKQFDVNVFGLLRIIKYIAPNLKKDGKLINVSSMASYGIFPFLAPYSMSKACADILLNNFELESGIKTVSIRPGSTSTKFWESSIELNKANFENTKKYKKESEFLVKNAQNNSLHATNPIYVAKKIASIIISKNNKHVYNIGLDSKLAKLTRFFSLDFTNKIVKLVLKNRLKTNEK